MHNPSETTSTLPLSSPEAWMLESQAGKKRLTSEGYQAALKAISGGVYWLPLSEGQPPMARFSPELMAVLRVLASLRMKDYQSTSRWTSDADLVGLGGELAALLYFGFTPEQILEGFLAGLQGDSGVDFHWAGEAIDVKCTAGSRLRFRFNRNNRHTARATTILFAKFHRGVEGSDSPAHVELLGWAFRFQLYPWMRSDERSQFVNFDTLSREGVSQHVVALREMEGGGHNA